MKITCKRSFRFSFYRHIISCFLIVLLQVYTLKADHHALIIAIGDYPANSGWSSISSQNDVVHIVAALEIVGFKSDHIQIIRDQEATRDGILKSFDRFIKNIAKGDQVYVHYSGHGQQVIDDDLNEEIDQLDEAIVPFDSPLYFDLGKYEGENLIRDDELAQISKRIRKKLGATGQLIWVLDSCHSGTGLRGIGKARGTDVIMANKDYIHSATVLEKSMEEDEIGLENLAPLLSLFGSSPRELNFETLDQQSKPVGSLSYSISVVLAEMNNPYSFQEFFSRVQQKMKVYAPRQNPQWEGPENVVLFEGQLKATKNEFFQVVEKIDDTHYKIAAGSVSDVFEGATIRMFSSSQPEVFSLGKVINASFNKAIVEIDDQLNIDETELLMVSIIDRVSPAIQLIIRNDVPESQFWHQMIKTSLDKISFSESNTNPDLYFYVEDQ